MNSFTPKDCPLCQIVNRRLPAVIISENDNVMAVLDLFPATPGHVLVLPRQHIENICTMPPKIGSQIMTMAITVARGIQQQLKPEGLNLIQANGAVAGQTINHFHLHLVPRYENDNVSLKFGHGSTPTEINQLEQIAAKIRKGLILSS
jgi:histidine triad (HIT) family protein